MNYKILLSVLLGAFVFISSCSNKVNGDNNTPNNPVLKSAQKVKFEDKQKFIIHGDLYKPEATIKKASKNPVVILLPMLSKTRETYYLIIPDLVKNGYVVLAIDFKGHGNSINYSGGGQKTFENFSLQDWGTLPDDVSAAIKYLSSLNYVDINKCAIIGASIGANTAIISSAQHTENIKTVIALSPGLDFKGLVPGLYIAKSNAKIFLIAAKDDQYSADSVEKLFKMAKTGNRYLNFPNGGHGTALFKTQPPIINLIIEYLKTNLPVNKP